VDVSIVSQETNRESGDEMTLQSDKFGRWAGLPASIVGALIGALMIAMLAAPAHAETLAAPAHAAPATSGGLASGCGVWATFPGPQLTDLHNGCPQELNVRLIFWTVFWGEHSDPSYCINIKGGEVKRFRRLAPSIFRRIEWC
jgi:hypothetical protein